MKDPDWVVIAQTGIPIHQSQKVLMRRFARCASGFIHEENNGVTENIDTYTTV